MYYYDIYYFILVFPAILIATWAQYQVKHSFSKYSKVPSQKRITGAYAAQQILNFYGISDVSIQPIGGSLTDNYNPKSKVISLSENVYNSTSIAAIGVACHEAGHAAQHAESYTPIKVRNSLVPVTRFGSVIGLPLAFLGLIIDTPFLIYFGLALYAAVFLFQLVTLPVEFNASKRAIKVIDETGLLMEEEIGGARKVLTAAALTYVASMIVALANLIRILIRFSRRRD